MFPCIVCVPCPLLATQPKCSPYTLLKYYRCFVSRITAKAYQLRANPQDAKAAVAYTSAAPSPASAARPSAISHNLPNHGAFPEAADTTTTPDAGLDGDDTAVCGARGGSEVHSWWPSAQLLLAEAQVAEEEPPEQVVLSLLRARIYLEAASPQNAEELVGAESVLQLRGALEAALQRSLEAVVARLPEDSWEAFRDRGEMVGPWDGVAVFKSWLGHGVTSAIA